LDIGCQDTDAVLCEVAHDALTDTTSSTYHNDTLTSKLVALWFTLAWRWRGKLCCLPTSASVILTSVLFPAVWAWAGSSPESGSVCGHQGTPVEAPKPSAHTMAGCAGLEAYQYVGTFIVGYCCH